MAAACERTSSYLGHRAIVNYSLTFAAAGSARAISAIVLMAGAGLVRIRCSPQNGRGIISPSIMRPSAMGLALPHNSAQLRRLP
jgi:hypothetical protein